MIVLRNKIHDSFLLSKFCCDIGEGIEDRTVVSPIWYRTKARIGHDKCLHASNIYIINVIHALPLFYSDIYKMSTRGDSKTLMKFNLTENMLYFIKAIFA